jgi:hypothetical protein
VHMHSIKSMEIKINLITSIKPEADFDISPNHNASV